ncbi:hypothetical protein J2X97_001492 [Epilithonimonas hungarica]|uniref:hypothetical protein n=1 Tax=Epilithonimonas hungarica TaxID=454006 RepID=UPI002789E11C|nr:hypothetical protein [Epilithonimonas hungarica]MDP9955855.1 hypothetical protein [Epilithonimonas hungarica]
MRKILLIIILFVFGLSFGQSKKKMTDEEKLTKCITENTNYFAFDGQKPNGKGWEIIENLFAENQFVAWGEYHNSPLLSQLTRYALESASKNGYKTWCVETSPFAASELMHIAKAKNPFENFLEIKQKRPNFTTFPFFETKEDFAMLSTAAKLGYSIWGIDQEFQMSFPYCLEKAFGSLPEKKQGKLKAVYDSLQTKWWNPEPKLLDSLKKEVRQPDLKRMLDDIKISEDIYYYSDNQKRADLMKANFFAYYDASKNKKVFFKMGSNHLAKGMNLETNLYDIGNAVYELSQRNKTKFSNVYCMVRYTEDKGIITDDLEEKDNQNPKVFSKLYDKEKWVLVDLRSLRLKMRYDNTITSDTYKIIEKYDYVLISPEILK